MTLKHNETNKKTASHIKTHGGRLLNARVDAAIGCRVEEENCARTPRNIALLPRARKATNAMIGLVLINPTKLRLGKKYRVSKQRRRGVYYVVDVFVKSDAVVQLFLMAG
jgi:hypothetical protein